MGAARDVLKNLNLFVDGKGLAGQIEEYNPPKETLKTEDFQGGGMIGPVELTMGIEKMEADCSLISYDKDMLALMGVVEGKQVQFTARGYLESFDGTKSSVAHKMRVKIKEIDRGTWKPGEKASLKLSFAVSYFKEERDGVTITEIDLENMVYIKNGVDLLSAARNALGM
ncbi:phage major tail tube protein [Dyella sp. 2RAF44]|uniref:phage major tail tube protein n=1 Tax=Dyella sp. 2RAF44 TaxID=3233000 RepID=UPI003F917DD6